MLTGITIHLNRGEYSRYEAQRSTVKARVIPEPSTGLASESVVVSLEKKGIPIATQTVTYDGDASKGTIVNFDLSSIIDSNGDTHINRGDYAITAVQGNVIAAEPFKVAIITADEIRQTYCQGLHLVSGYKMMPKRQPAVVTGLTITNISKGTKRGIYALKYDSTNQTLSWADGYAIPITEDSQSEILIDTKGGYCEVDIDYYMLPSDDAAEGILVDQEELTNSYLQVEIERATQEVESMLKIYLEPTRVATEPYYSNPKQGEYFDGRAAPLCFYEKDFNIRSLGWHLDIPYNQVGRITDLVGYIGNQKALEITAGALTVNRKSGSCDVLPFTGQYSAFYTFFMGMNFWGVREFIADFWRYKAVLGIDEKLPAEIIKLIGYTAAMSILTTAEQAYRAGVNSESISKDGVSRSQSYNAKGVYDSAIQEYKDWNEKNMPRLRQLYRGIPMVVI